MPSTNIPFGSSQAVKRWSPALFVEINKQSFFSRKKFIGDSDMACIQRLTDLESSAGDQIVFDLCLQLRGRPTTGDQRLEGKEEGLRFYQDAVKIDQARKAVSAGGAMTRKRTVHNTRTIAKQRLAEYWAKWDDELMFIYLCGSRGINPNFIEELAYVGHAGVAIEAPDAGHMVYGGDATGKGDLDSADKMTRALIMKAKVKAENMQATDPQYQNMMPLMIEGEPHYVQIMHDFQQYDLQTADTDGWVKIQHSLATAEGRKSPLVKGGMGMIDNVVLYKHQNIVRFSDYGTGSNVAAARSVLLGRQAGVIAYGSKRGRDRFSWKEKMIDYGNEPTVAAGKILGVKKTRFNGKDFGVVSIDTAAADPT